MRINWARGTRRTLAALSVPYLIGLSIWAAYAWRDYIVADQNVDQIERRNTSPPAFTVNERVALDRLTRVAGSKLDSTERQLVDRYIEQDNLVRDRQRAWLKRNDTDQKFWSIIAYGMLPAALLAIGAAIAWIIRGFISA